MKRRLINPPGTEMVYQAWHFSQAVRVGDTIHVSGQVGADEKGVAEGIEAQARVALSNLSRVLEAAGATLADVVELTTFHVDMAEVMAFGKVKDEFFPKNYPAWTAVGTSGLVLPNLRVEVRATAVAGSAEVEGA
ncbi:2-aminomuconate deaminase [Myxococcaceae bacterium]|jgi:enamine deaminase RidA (YjgF/YER057c/UK114 family)|nr:2-aminomuconate deaminase [Myxococcaceae bacterium]